MNEKKHTLTPLKDIIATILRDTSLPFNPDDARIFKVWNEVVGSVIARNAQPSWIKKGRLRVMVSDPIWLQELEFAGETIKEKLNKRLGRSAVQSIEFRIGHQ